MVAVVEITVAVSTVCGRGNCGRGRGVLAHAACARACCVPETRLQLKQVEDHADDAQ